MQTDACEVCKEREQRANEEEAHGLPYPEARVDANLAELLVHTQ